MPPLSLLIKPAAGLCQYRCRYCFYEDVLSHREKPRSAVMKTDVLEALVRKALSYGEGSVTFSFQGGEPTLAGLDFYRALIRLQRKYRKGARIFNCIQTNGGLIDDEWAGFLAENRFLVGLSMDGTRETHDEYRRDADGNGTFSQTEAAARLLSRHGVDFNILCVVNRLTASRPEETYEALRPYRFLQFIPCIDGFDGNGPFFAPSAEEFGAFLIKTFDLYRRDILAGQYVSVRSFDNYIQILNGRRPESCAMTGRCACYFVIDADGSAYPCDFYVLDSWRLGNIQSDSFGSMLDSPRAKEFVASSVYMRPECRKCPHYALCRGGCRRDREPFDEFGRPGKNRYCEGFRVFFDARGGELRALARMAASRYL